MKNIILVGLGGFLGAILRYSGFILLERFHFKVFHNLFGSTLVVNLFGCFLAGLLINFLENLDLRLFLLIGFLGALTTFSTFSMENLILLNQKNYGLLTLYVLIHILGSLLLLILGIEIQQWLTHE